MDLYQVAGSMYRSSLFLATVLMGTPIPLLGDRTNALVQPAASEKSALEVEAIARSVTVEIKLKSNPSAVGSGVILNKKGDLYTLVTNRHVVCGSGRGRCSELPSGESYSLGLSDGQQYRVKASSIRLLGNDLDLAIIQFRSDRNYAVAKVAVPGSLKADDKVYTAGFPLEQPGFTFGEGKAIAVVNKRLTGDNGGYTIVYDAFTLPGMSGGGVFNSNGQLVAIHGYGDRFRENTEVDSTSRVGSKIGFNRGIPVRWLVQNLSGVDIDLGVARSIYNTSLIPAQVAVGADEYFISGFNKFVEPGDNAVAGKQQAIQKFSTAIRLNPRYQSAYFMRAISYEQIQEFQQSLADYNQAVLLNPKDSAAYYNRALLKKNKLNDIQGALIDYNQAILIDPRYSAAYNNRALLKYEKLNDIQGALADYNQAILINPKHSVAYNNRALLKYEKLTDTQGALADYNQAILINPKYSEAYNNRANLKYEKLNDIQGALADYNQAILINPENAFAYNNRALLKYEKLNDMQGSLTDYNQAILINPKYSEAYMGRATLKHEKLNDIQGSLVDYNQAILINPKYSEAYYNRANLKYERLKDIQGAIADYDKAILINSRFVEAYNNRGRLKAQLNDRPGAIQDLRQAVRLFREQGNIQNSQITIRALQQLGATE
jgi:tetratricopeptide (TPR) repeat protein